MTSSFSDLQPTAPDAAGVVGGDFAGLGPVVIPLPGGANITLFGHVD